MNPAEEFVSQNGMSVDQAWQKVLEWKLAGENDRVKKGCENIVKYFPDHDAKALLSLIEAQSIKIENPEEKEKHQVKKEKMNFSQTINFLITGKKPDQETPSPQDSSPTQVGNTQKVDTPIKNTSPKKDSGFLSTQKPRKDDPSLPEENSINETDRMFGALSYFTVLCFFVLFARRDSAFVQYHAWQGLTLFALLIASLPFYFVFSFLFGAIFWLLYVLYFGMLFYASSVAFSGRYLHIPVVSDIAKKMQGREISEEYED